MTEHQPVYRTATIRKLKRTHDDSQFESSEFTRTSTLKSRSQISRPILRSASVIKTRHIKENLCSYGSYTDDQPENLIFRRGKLIFCYLCCKRKEGNHSNAIGHDQCAITKPIRSSIKLVASSTNSNTQNLQSSM